MKNLRTKKLEYAEFRHHCDLCGISDPDALHLIKKNAELLSIGINNISMIYDPDIIVVNSPLYRKLPIMIDYINNALSSRFTKRNHCSKYTSRGKSNSLRRRSCHCSTLLEHPQIKI